MKVALITGPCEPGKCGVGDYTAMLAGELCKAGLQVEIVHGGNWRFFRLPSLMRLVRRTAADILHLQYPTAGFGYKLGPQGLAVALQCVATIHEASNAHILRKLALYPFALRARHVIFTSREELAFAMRWAPWVESKSSVIPVGSNIQGARSDAKRDIKEILYFGLVMPRKGLEEVLALGALLGRNGRDFRLRIVGSHRAEHAAYVDELHRKAEGLPVLWEENLPAIEVSQRLAGAWVAYLPYPDGASERRTTLKAVLTSGMAVVTTRGPNTPADLGSVVKFCASPSEAYQLICELTAAPANAEDLGNRARAYAQRYSWEAIARQHIAVYERLVERPAGMSEHEVEEQIIA